MKQRTLDTPKDWAIVIYTVLGLAVICFPGGVLDFLEEHQSDYFLSAPIELMKAIDRVSAAIGLSKVGAELRGAFAALVEPDERP
jgi:hypothetical protein